jgi:hypothetical protein
MSKPSQSTKPKASERLSAIENALVPTQRRVGELEMVLFNLSRENEILKDALQLLHEKLESVIVLANEGKTLSNENINEKVVLLKEQALKDKVQDLVDAGQVKVAEEVTDNSLVVARELNKDGTVENPRIQFLTSRLIEELQNKFVGKKVGELVKGEEDKLDLEIMEIYDITINELGAQGEESEQQEEQVEEAENKGEGADSVPSDQEETIAKEE